MEISQIEGIIEALLFAAGDPLSIDKICEILDLDKKTAKSIINNMADNINFSSNRGLFLREINNKYQLCSKPDYFDYIKCLAEPRQKQGLSQAAFEVLSIIAYRQPVTKAKIEQIRGVSSDSAMTRLQERNLIREAGRLDAPGKPILYETTDEFLRSFGFKSVGDLPVLSMNEIEVQQALEAHAAQQEEEKNKV